MKSITDQGSVELPKNTKRKEAGTEGQSQPKKKRLNKVTPRHCLYCDETLSRKQAWDNHMKRKHSKAPYVQFKDLKQVQVAQGFGHTDQVVLTTPEAVPVYPHLAVAVSPSSWQSAGVPPQPSSSGHSEAQQRYAPIVCGVSEQISTTNPSCDTNELPTDFDDIFASLPATQQPYKSHSQMLGKFKYGLPAKF